jgi:serine/threonine protein kinase
MGAPKKGDILLGKYRIEEILGQGGMGIVVAAQHLELGDRVAIKLLLDDMSDMPENQERFLHEARAARRIKSEHVTRVTDVGRLETGELYIVMEYLEGMNLGEVRRKCGPLEVEVAVDYVLQALEALAEAHLHRIIHRDLKPANLFLTTHADGTPLVKVLDFGISKVLSAPAQNGEVLITRSGMLMGSPNYMAPEQIASSRSVDARVDIWAIGVVLYSLITGKLPFGGSSPVHTFALILESAPPPPSEVRPDVPPELDAVILRCLEKSPDARFLSVAALAAALGPFAPPRARTSVDRIARVLGVPVVHSSSEPPQRASRSSLSAPPPPPNDVPTVPLLEMHAPQRSQPTLVTGTGMSRTIERVKSAAQATGALAFVGAGCAAALGMIVFFSVISKPADAEPSTPLASATLTPASSPAPTPMPPPILTSPSLPVSDASGAIPGEAPSTSPPSSQTVTPSSQSAARSTPKAPKPKLIPTSEPTVKPAPPPEKDSGSPPKPALSTDDEPGLPDTRN